MGQLGEEVRQQRDVFLEVGWELEDRGAEACVESLYGAGEFCEGFLEVLEAPEVRDELGGLGEEEEVGWHLAGPALEQLGGGSPPGGVDHFDGREVVAVEAQHLLVLHLWWIEAAPPLFVAPAAGASQNSSCKRAAVRLVH